jgi:transcriptional regulator with XRE-family HTH domain
MRQGEEITPGVLAWARKTAGLSLEEAATKLGLNSSRSSSAAEKLAELEAGGRPVTRPRLLKAAALYHRPLVTFYLPAPPRKGERGQDYRKTGGAATPRENALLDALVRNVRSRQEMVRAVLVDEGDREPLPFFGSLSMGRGIAVLERAIRSVLNVELAEQQAAKTPDDLFNKLRTAAERAGVFVLLLGDLGSHHSAIDPEVFRGFALADPVAPFVIINDQDAKPRAPSRSLGTMPEGASRSPPWAESRTYSWWSSTKRRVVSARRRVSRRCVRTLLGR